MQCFATCRFGFEAVVASELRRLSLDVGKVEDARVFFDADMRGLARANMFLRSADRVFLLVGQFGAETFDMLYEGTRALPWEEYCRVDTFIHVKGKQARSRLHSVSDAQSIVKKAIIDRLSDRYKINRFSENGKKVIIEVGILNDIATLALDASGAGLSRRGYHTLNTQAPLSETLAAGLVLISKWRADAPLIDPFCGSGTIAIEARMIADNRAPGLNRTFAAEEWQFIKGGEFDLAREEARDAVKPSRVEIIGSDIDAKSLDIARRHAKKAGVSVRFERRDAREIVVNEPSCVVCNPPYGERLGSRKDAERLCAEAGKHLKALPLISMTVLSAMPSFERFFGARADKRRKVYNAGLRCNIYQYNF